MIKRVTLAALVVASISVFAPTMQAAQAAVGPYGGTAGVDLVHVNAVNLPGQVADVSVSPATADVKSTGLATPAGKRSHAKGTNLDASLLNTIPIQALVTAEQSAPPDNPNETKTGPLIPLPADPVLNANVTTAHAQARWAGDDACVKPGTPISHAKVEVADAKVLTSPTAAPVGTAVVALDNPQGTTVFTESTVGLIDVAGQTTKGVKSVTLTQLTSITLFKGSTSELRINVVAPPVVTAIATGQPGGATVTYSEPILQVYQGNVLLGELNATNLNLTIPGAPLIQLTLGTLTKTVAANGTSASGSANLLDVKVLAAAGAVDPLVGLSIAAGKVTANVPAGGVNCPPPLNPLREVHKDSSSADVARNASFEYNLAVPNRGTCVLTKVKVVDTVTGPAGTTVVATTPPASTVEGLTFTWNDIGPIQPNETKVLKIRLKVPAGANIGDKYHDHLAVSAVCDGETVDKPVDLDGPTVGQPTGPCDLSASNISASHLEVLPGETFLYYIHVANQGAATCDGVHVADTLPPDVTFVSCSDNCANTGQNVAWDLGPFAGGESRDLFVVVKVKDGTPVGTHLPSKADITTKSNTRTVTVSTPGPVVSGNSILAPADPARWTRRAGLAATGTPPFRVPLGWALVLAGAGLFAVRRRVTGRQT